MTRIEPPKQTNATNTCRCRDGTRTGLHLLIRHAYWSKTPTADTSRLKIKKTPTVSSRDHGVSW
ncbi:MAG: hypothetical protein DMF04_02140 [Verrucomicrobia bacterium]|nr:MAG: hypothetical protein DMF04_02140 [Verrucomicrobiota bacterium]